MLVNGFEHNLPRVFNDGHDKYAPKVTDITTVYRFKCLQDIIFRKSLVSTKTNFGPTTAETGMPLMCTTLDAKIYKSTTENLEFY